MFDTQDSTALPILPPVRIKALLDRLIDYGGWYRDFIMDLLSAEDFSFFNKYSLGDMGILYPGGPTQDQTWIENYPSWGYLEGPNFEGVGLFPGIFEVVRDQYNRGDYDTGLVDWVPLVGAQPHFEINWTRYAQVLVVSKAVCCLHQYEIVRAGAICLGGWPYPQGLPKGTKLTRSKGGT